MKRLSGALLALTLCTPAFAYDLYNESTCSPGAKWATGTTVKVRVLGESLLDYEASRGVTGPAAFAALSAMMADVTAVINEYNQVGGSTLRLESATGYAGQTNL